MRRSIFLAGLLAVAVCAATLGLSLATAAKRHQGLPIAAVKPAEQDRPGHFIVARGRYTNGEGFAVFVGRDRVEAGGIAEDQVCVGIEVGPSSCGSRRLSRRDPIDIDESVDDCHGSVVFGHVISAARRVEVSFPNRARFDAELVPMPREVRPHEKVFVLHVKGRRFAKRVTAVDGNGNAVGTASFGPRDFNSLC